MKVKFPYILSVLAMVGGVFISIIFGANEGFFKDRIAKGIDQNIKIQSIQDIEVKNQKIKSEQDKNWRYYQRYHFHASGIAALSLSLLVFLAYIKTSSKKKLIAAYMISIGGFLYPFVWLMAAIYGPEMGRDEAKEAFAILGYMGGVYLLGILFTLYLAVMNPLKAPLSGLE